MSGIAGTFTRFDAVPTRKVVRVHVEFPIEQANQVLETLGGFPDPSNAQWIALAPLVVQPEEDKPKGGKIAQRAGILCNEGGFKVFCEETHGDEPEQVIYALCRIKSRADLDHDENAARAFNDLQGQYQAWLQT